MARQRGKPRKYEDYVKPYLPLISEWCQTMTEQQIAKKLGIGYSTWNQYKVDYPEVKEAIKKGRQNLVADLKGALIKKAKGYEYVETKETTERVKWPEEMYIALLDAGFTPQQIASSRIVKTEVSHKIAAPDVAAINLALKNYDREGWANDPQMLDIRKKELELREKQIENNEW
jgi:transposase